MDDFHFAVCETHCLCLDDTLFCADLGCTASSMASMALVDQIHYLTDNSPGSPCVLTVQLIFHKSKNTNAENLYASTIITHNKCHH